MAVEVDEMGDGKITPFRKREDDAPKKERITVKPQSLTVAELRCHLPAKAKEFLQYLELETYGKKGFQDRKMPTHWAEFDMRTCMELLDMEKPNITRLRDSLVALRIIETMIDKRGQMWIGWNLNTDEWINASKRGGVREGSGRPKNNQNDNEQPVIILPTFSNQNDNDRYQNDSDEQIKMITSNRHDDSDSQAPQDASRRYQETDQEDQEILDANASLGANAPDTLPVPQGKSRKKRVIAIPDEEDPAYRVALYLQRAITKYAPDATIPEETPKGLAAWTQETRVLLHKKKPPDIKLVIDFVAATDFWHPHILSPRKLKDKFDTLLVQAKKGNTPNGQQNRPVSSHAQTSRRGQVASNSQRHAAPGDDD